MTLQSPHSRRTYVLFRGLRIGVAVLLAVAAAFSIGSAALVPSYILLRADARILQSLSESAASSFDKKRYKALLSIAHESTAALQRLEAIVDMPPERDLSFVARVAREHRITLRQIHARVVTKEAAPAMRLAISGVAPTRAAVIAFRDALKKGPFSSVTLPLNTLVADTEVPFTITLVRAQVYEK